MRKPRLLQNGAKYHVSAKINRGENALQSDEIKKMFIEKVKICKTKYKFEIYNFVIMDNHIHFIIKPLKNESLSKIMQWILSVFAMCYNKIHKYVGHVWQGRFWSKIITDIKHFFDAFNYISNNPVKKQIVNKAEEYEYGGLYYIQKGIFDIVDKYNVGTA